MAFFDPKKNDPMTTLLYTFNTPIDREFNPL